MPKVQLVSKQIRIVGEDRAAKQSLLFWTAGFKHLLTLYEGGARPPAVRLPALKAIIGSWVEARV